MNTAKTCAACGTKLNAEGLCPACLLNLGMATRTVLMEGGVARSPAVRPVPGSSFGPYRIVRLLGRGGMGEVYEAEDATTGRRMAVKVLNQALATDEDRKRFIREGRTAATVRDPHVVYVYGSQEIEGAPVIAMELVGGGTLKDRVQKGRPLPAADAVDDMLQVIDGLETAAKAGVLHRDIKPANCFVDRDGTIKVGDFGLSISTLGHLESQHVTAPGSLLGTPAFASPEQLRGSQLDVRSDIYSVGATLFFLLTGKPPFEADAIVNLISAVLDKAPPSPRTLQPGIPSGLASVVLKCLAKDPKERFSNYDELRHALTPFCSTAPQPAMLGLRFVAGFVDSFFADLPGIVYAMFVGSMILQVMAPGGLTPVNLVLLSAFIAWQLLYYGWSEHRWGATFGKWLCGLRVVGPDRQPLTLGRSLLRSLIYLFVMSWAQHLVNFLVHSREDIRLMAQGAMMNLTEFVGLILWALLFVTLRRHNGFAGLHELATGTRVVTKAWRLQARPAWCDGAKADATGGTAGTTPSLLTDRIGPYAVLDASRGHVVLARDEVLRRNVWIVKQAAGSPPLTPARRDLSRPGRLRWLNGVRIGSEAWDAYEAPDGKFLHDVPHAARTWASVRFWLLDLAEEISAGMRDGAPAPLALENVFITTQGRALLMDRDFTGPAGEAVPLPGLPEAQKFLADVVTATLGAEPSGLPMEVPFFLTNLRERSLHAMEVLIGNLKSFTEKLPAVTRRRRAGSMFLAPACFAMIGVMMTVAMYFKTTDPAKLRVVGEEQEDIGEMTTVLTMYAVSSTNDPSQDLRNKVGTIIAKRYAKQVNDPGFWETHTSFGIVSMTLKKDLRSSAQDAAKRYAHATDEELKNADEELKKVRAASAKNSQTIRPFVGLVAFFGGLMLLGIFNLVCSIIGLTPGLRLFGMAVVDRRGRKASRWRLVWRSLVAWSPFVLMPFLMPLAGTFHINAIFVFALLGLPYIVGIYMTIYRPSRGIHDRAAGTWLVPR